MGRERRRRTRRSTSSTSSGATAGPSTPPVVGATIPQPASTSRPAVTHTPVQVRSDRVLAREAATMMSEIKRVALVSGVCFGMLAVLVVVDRLQ